MDVTNLPDLSRLDDRSRPPERSDSVGLPDAAPDPASGETGDGRHGGARVAVAAAGALALCGAAFLGGRLSTRAEISDADDERDAARAVLTDVRQERVDARVDLVTARVREAALTARLAKSAEEVTALGAEAGRATAAYESTAVCAAAIEAGRAGFDAFETFFDLVLAYGSTPEELVPRDVQSDVLDAWVTIDSSRSSFLELAGPCWAALPETTTS
jgi:hypothetical protein